MSVQSSLLWRLCPHEHRWSPEAFSLVYCWGGTLSTLYFPSLNTPISHNIEGGVGNLGKDSEAERKRRKGRLMEGKERKREEKLLNSYHCLHVNWTWSRFHEHRKPQVQSAETLQRERGRHQETETRRTSACKTVIHTLSNTQNDKKEIWVDWDQ